MQNNENFGKDIDIKKLFKIIKKRFWILFIFTTIFTAVGGIYSYKFQTPLYQSSSRYLLDGISADQVGTYDVIIKDPSILDKVIEQLKLNTNSESLNQQISIVNNSQVVTVTVTGSNPMLTSKITNTIIDIFQQEIKNITGYTGMKIISPAKVNLTPINQGHFKTILVSFVLGLILGIGLVFFLNSLDDTFTSVNEIERILELPVLGGISKVKKISWRKMKKIEKSLHLRGESFGSK